MFAVFITRRQTCWNSKLLDHTNILKPILDIELSATDFCHLLYDVKIIRITLNHGFLYVMAAHEPNSKQKETLYACQL